MIIEFPSQFVPGSLHTIWNDIGTIKDRNDGSEKKALLDLSNVIFTDAEGANYIALIPVFLENLGLNITINLPKNDRVLSFLDLLGILEFLHSKYHITGYEKPHTPIYSHHEMILGVHEKIISRAAHSYIINSGQIPSLFRDDVIKHHMFAIDEDTAKNFSLVLFELVANIFDHSEETTGCITIQYRKNPRASKASLIGQMFLAVSDLGIGIEMSLRDRVSEESGKAPQGISGWEILEYAIQPGVSRTRLGIRGYGLHSVTQVADISNISSTTGSLYIDNRKKKKKGSYIDYMPGTSVLLTLDVHDKNTKQYRQKKTDA